MPHADPSELLRDLDPEQLQAVQQVRGPVVIHAGAGSGKTRVISRRTAYAIATDAVPADQVLVVTFTDKAATEMVDRLRALGLSRVTARTFHAHALSQLRHFWPARHDGAPLPEILANKGLIVGRLARQLPGHNRFTPSKDLADEIEWAKSRRIEPRRYEAEAAAAGRESPIPADLFVRVYGDYERTKTRMNRIDFDDLLLDTVALLETDATAAETVRARKRWFSVDEYQDTNPLQQRLLELWLGNREDVCVVGDEDQTIYTFTGATSDYLTGFATRHPAAREITLSRNYRSSPEILALANRLLAAEGRRKQLIATMPPGPRPSIDRFADAEAELAHLVATIRRLVGEGIPASEIAILVRINAQIPPIEAALTKARIPFLVRGQRFFERPEIRDALRLLRRLPEDAIGSRLLAAFDARLRSELGFEDESSGGVGGAGAAGGPPSRAGAEARERTASLALLLEIAGEAVAARHDIDRAALAADFDARAAAEGETGTDGVNLLTLHRAKGLEWDAVLLPQLEEGTLPIRQAESDEELAEERRLLYVGLTRARRHLALSWAERRIGQGDRETRRRPSEFLAALVDRPARRVTVLPGAPMAPPHRARDADSPLMTALREWRLTTARSEGVSAFIIAPDTLLLEIAEQRPTTIAALRRVKGMGPSRLARYGEEMLEVVRTAVA
ncbi:MAG: ATP-dependent DNA helicase UvrD2 [Chloroflexi bacterium]|nr:ATP-dependent DNA helicase UvrD2 [Chloroflexota bacterium]